MKKEKESQAEEIQKLKVELAIQEWEAVIAVIEQSNAPHIQVKSVVQELIKQLQPQIPKEDEKTTG